MRRILDAKYEKADLNKATAEQCQHLTSTESHRLLHRVNKFEDLFDCKLGTWKTTPVDLEVKDKAKTVCSWPFPVPKVHEVMSRKEVKRLVSLAGPKEANESKWGAPSFAQPKAKTNRVRFLSDFWSLNRQLKRNP